MAATGGGGPAPRTPSTRGPITIQPRSDASRAITPLPYPSKNAFSLPPIPCRATTTGTGSFRSSSFDGMRMRMTDAVLAGRDG